MRIFLRFFSFLALLSILLDFRIEANAQNSAPQARPTSPFTADLTKKADGYLEWIKKDKAAAASKYEALKRQIEASRAYYAGDYFCIYDLEKVIKDNPKDLTAWIMLADAASKNTDASFSSWENIEKSKLAALNAYEVASNPLDKAVILQFLSSIDTSFTEAYRAEESKIGQKKIDDRLRFLLTDYPHIFNLYEIDIPEKSDVGSACFVFTKLLRKLRRFRYEDYITLQPQPKDFSVVAKGNRLCISGLAFGSAYHVTLKKGLAGEGDYKLSEEQSIDLLIKHRKPSIVFRERGYILPAKGPQILPLKAINVPSVKIRVFKIPLQSLPITLAADFFLNQLVSWDIKAIKTQVGELIAEGVFDSNGSIDETILRGLPLGKVLRKSLEPGIYVVQAQIKDKDSYTQDENSTQWIVVSDIGLSTFSGPDGIHVFSRSLATAKELEGVELRIIARNGRILGSVETDKNGYAHFDEKILSGKDSNQPVFIQATRQGKDFTFISFTKEGFDFSDRGAKGRAPPQKADAYIYTDRGIYRPGEKVNITALLRNQAGLSIPNVPLTLKVCRPDGLEVLAQVTQDVGAGAHTFVLNTQASSYSGMWLVSAYLDPKEPAIGSATFHLADFVPPRIDVKASLKREVLHPLETLVMDVTARYFYGPWAADSKVDGLVELVVEDKPFKQWENYVFGLEEETWVPLKFKAESSYTNDKGQATLQNNIYAQPDTTKILSAKSTATVFEVGGRGRSVTEKVLFWHQPYVIGIFPQFKEGTSPANGDATFNLIAVDEAGQQKKAENLKYTLYEETHSFTWFRSGNSWNYESTIDDRAVATGHVNINDNGPTIFKTPVQYGFYRIEIMDEKAGVASSFRFHAGWSGTTELPDRPDMIQMALDKVSYKIGETAILSVVSPFEGELNVVAIDENRCQRIFRGQAHSKGTRVEIPLTKELLQKSGIYLMATVYRPSDVKSEKNPGRAIGLIWVDAKTSMPKIEMSIKAPTVVQPEKDFEVSVCLGKRHKNPYVSIAVVDEAILQLTNFETPDPFNYLFDQTRLSYFIRDSYGQLINPFGARPGDFKVGGDGLVQKALKKLAVRSFKTVSLQSGVLSDFIDSQEKGCPQLAKFLFKLPDFSGQVRVMAVAWNEEATGSADVTTVVRELLETSIILPRFLAPGDQTTLIADAQNLTDSQGTFKLTLKAEGEISLLKDFSQTLTLAKDQIVHLPFEVKAKQAGVGKLTLYAEGPQGLILEKKWEIAIRSSVFEVTQQSAGILKPNETLILDSSKLSNFIPETGQLDLDIGSQPTFGAERLRKELKEYPYVCLEQLVSRAVAELYAPKEKRDASKIVDIITQLLSLQRFDGTFAFWSANGPAQPFLSLYAIDLLNKIQAENFDVSQVLFARGIEWIKEIIRQSSENDKELHAKAYAHYILAKQDQGTLGTLKYFADNHQDRLKNRSDLAFIGAAFALYGDEQSAKLWFDKALSVKKTSEDDRDFFQSWVSETAVLVAMMAQTAQDPQKVRDLALQLEDMTVKSERLSTFDKGWLIRAAHALSLQTKAYALSINEEKFEGAKPLHRDFTFETLKSTVTLKNLGPTPLNYALTAIGEPQDPSKIPSKGFSLTRELYDLNGQLIKDDQARSGDLFLVILKGELYEGNTHEIMAVDLLPAGFEIEAIEFDGSYLKSDLVWLKDLTPLSRVEKRDDRYVSAFRMTQPGKFVMAYFVRALNPGVYKYPGAIVESMYRPEFSARTEEGVLTIKP